MNVSDGTARIASVVKEHISNGKMVQDVGSDVVFCLPEFDEEGARQRDKFPALFDELDAKMDALGLDSYGVSDTTLEEVVIDVWSYCCNFNEMKFTFSGKIFLRVADDPSADIDFPDSTPQGKTQKMPIVHVSSIL